MSGPLACLNIGCGDRFHPAWTNVDIVPADPSVIAHDIRRGLPFADGTFAVVYHSHVLEHLTREEARALLRSCHRILRPAGILRVVVPDLEQIARAYLAALWRAETGDVNADIDHEWMILELYDQVVRERRGGSFIDLVHASRARNAGFIRERWGLEGERLLEAAAPVPPADTRIASGGGQRAWWWRRLRELMTSPNARRDVLVSRLLGDEYRLLEAARFRSSGEIHRWMYDRRSLARLLVESGFSDPSPRGAAESSVPEWPRFGLDAGPDGRVHKPDSLFMEARRLTRDRLGLDQPGASD